MTRAPLPPGPRVPMFGTLILPGRNPLAIFARFARDYGDLVTFRMGGARVFFVNHPDHVRQVLVADHKNFTKSRALERALTDVLESFWLALLPFSDAIERCRSVPSADRYGHEPSSTH